MSITAFVFVLVFLMGIAATLFRSPIYGLYTYLWAFYLDPSSHWWSVDVPDLRWLQVAAIVALVGVLLRLPPDTDRPAWHANTGARLLIVFVAWMWLQNYWAISPEKQFEGSMLFTKHVIVYYLIYRILRTRKDILRFALAHVAGCFYFGFQALGASGGRLEDLGGAVNNANTLGMHVTTGLVFASFLFLGFRSYPRWLSFASIPLILNTLVLVQSRGAFLGAAFAGMVGFLLIPRVLKKGFIVASLLGVVLLGMLAHEQFWDRMSSLMGVVDETQVLDASAASRVDIAKAGWEMAKDYPFGTGYRGTSILSPFYMDEKVLSRHTGARSAHNTFMAALTEQGFVGAFLYLAMVLWVALTLRYLKSLDRESLPTDLTVFRTMVGASLAGAFMSGQFTNVLQAEVQIWCLALLSVLVNESKKAVAGEGESAGEDSGLALPAPESPRV